MLFVRNLAIAESHDSDQRNAEPLREYRAVRDDYGIVDAGASDSVKRAILVLKMGWSGQRAGGPTG